MDKPAMITKMVREELSRFLNEANIVGDDRFKFKQRVNNSTFSNYESFTSDFDSKVTASDFIISWGVSFWTNDSGIENFIIDVTDVQGNFMLQLFDKHTMEMKQETPKNINDFEWKYVIGNANLTKNGSLYIIGLSFDFKNKTCKVTL